MKSFFNKFQSKRKMFNPFSYFKLVNNIDVDVFTDDYNTDQIKDDDEITHHIDQELSHINITPINSDNIINMSIYDKNYASYLFLTSISLN